MHLCGSGCAARGIFVGWIAKRTELQRIHRNAAENLHKGSIPLLST